jgi:putative DNA primase/helicase
MPLEPDKSFSIAIGKSREDKNWKNVTVTWDDLCLKLSQVHRTPESYREYIAAHKDRQTEIKDIGGYVGGYIVGGRRKPEAVTERSLVALEVDAGGWGPWTDVLLGSTAAFLHTTHKHNSADPRYRIVMPLSRSCSVGEWEAVSRMIGSDIGIDLLDHTAFQANRLFYWASASKDGEFKSSRVPGAWIDVDQVLKRYEKRDSLGQIVDDWKNMSQWPRAVAEREKLNRSIARQADPLTKPGLVGAFCRAFSIHEAIERFLGKSYIGAAENGRYTYINGSTSGGLVTYESKFAFSHHSTDPAGDQLCNAFDLVRLHLFGSLDEDSSATTSRGTPSASAMLDMVEKLPEVRRQIATDRMASSRFRDFLTGAPVKPTAEAPELPNDGWKSVGEALDTVRMQEAQKNAGDAGANGVDPALQTGQSRVAAAEVLGIARENRFEAPKWTEELEYDKRGQLLTSAKNLQLIFENDANLQGLFQLDTFSGARKLTRCPVWSFGRSASGEGEDSLQLQDSDRAWLRIYLDTVYKISHIGKIGDALEAALAANQVHPVREYLQGLQWDELPRVDTALIESMGAEDCEYVRTVMRKTMIGAVARVFKPGCKMDNVLVLTGLEGLGKSGFFEALGKQWHSSSPGELGTVKAAENLRGTWIMELGDLSGARRADIEEIKNFITTRYDKYRPAYGHEVVKIARQSIYGGTSNEKEPLKDEPGNRRWWPVAVGDRDTVLEKKKILTPAYVDQLWAEAYQMFKEGQTWWLSNEQEEEARVRQRAATEMDPWEPLIIDYLKMSVPDTYSAMTLMERRNYFQGIVPLKGESHPRSTVCSAQVWEECLGLDRTKMQSWDGRRITKIILRQNGWIQQHAVRFPWYGVTRGMRLPYVSAVGE